MVKRRPGALTDQETVFASVYGNTGDGTVSAIIAGYAKPAESFRRVAAREAVQETVRKIQERRVIEDLMPKALNLLERAIGDETWKPEVRIKAAAEVRQWVQQVTGAGATDKAPEDMTPDELAARIATLRARQAQLAEGAKVIDVEPIDDSPGDDVFG